MDGGHREVMRGFCDLLLASVSFLTPEKERV